MNASATAVAEPARAQEAAGLVNRGFCEHCHTIVPARHEAVDGKMYLVKDCPNCGEVRTYVSSDAERYMEKRRMCGYMGEAMETCHLRCPNCKEHGFTYTLINIDVTNRCNMNCPICLANLDAMGFEFNPPIEYFERIFKQLARRDPKPRVVFFGGEPTARKDFLDIVRLAKKYRLPRRVVTNGLMLAKKDYCDALLDTGTHVLMALDSLRQSSYEKIRKHPKALELKLKAMDNIRKYRLPEDSDQWSSRRMTLMCTVGIGVNDKDIGEFFQFCHERREQVASVALIPLQVTPGPEQVAPVSTTMEDVERICDEQLPGTEFLPAAMLQKFKTIEETFGTRITLGGAHPNCESMTLLVADEKQYHPASRFLKKSFRETVEDAIAWDRRMGERLKKSWFARLFGKRGRQFLVVMGLVGLARRHLRFGRILGPRPVRSFFAMMWRKITTGKQLKKLVRRYFGVRGVLRMIVLPYEDEGWLESSRLKSCPVGFAHEDPKSGDVATTPFCSYIIYKNEILRKSSERWGVAK